MNLYLISHYKNQACQYLEESAKERNISVKYIFTQKDFEEYSASMTQNDIIYRVGSGKRMKGLEKLCILKGVTPLASPVRHTIDWSIEASEYYGTQHVPRKRILEFDESIVRDYVSELGGYPVVLKISGKSHGEGVSKMGTEEELMARISNLDFDTQVVDIKQYIESDGHIRVIVLGNQVMGAIKYLKPSHDFRTNLRGSVSVESVSIDSLTSSVAIQAVHNENHVFGGVDIIVDQEGNPYVMEVNIPCFFPRVQDALHEDISGSIIDYLVQKVHQK